MPLLNDIRNTPLLWLLVLVPVVLVAHALAGGPHAAVLFRYWRSAAGSAAEPATEAVASRTGDTIGGLLNATLGNLTELLIALALVRRAIRTGEGLDRLRDRHQYLFMLGSPSCSGAQASYPGVQPNSARLQAGLLFLATIAILVPSVVADPDAGAAAKTFTHTLSASLAVVLIITYALGLLFSLKTHREFFGAAQHGDEHGEEWPMSLALVTLAGVTVLVALTSEIFVESVQQAATSLGLSPAFVGFIIVALAGAAGNGFAFCRAQEQARSQRRHRAGRVADRAVRRAGTGATSWCSGPPRWT
jgi:Ca2+:H+ antiporter